MSDTPDENADLTARLEALEAHVAHQEQVIGDLNEVVTSHWRKIERLEKLVTQLRETLLTMAPAREGPEPPPPHY